MCEFFIYLLVLFAVMFLPNVVYLVFGLIFARSDRFRDFGVRLLGMSMLAPRLTAMMCHRCCEDTPCKNWTCENYYHAKKGR